MPYEQVSMVTPQAALLCLLVTPQAALLCLLVTPQAALLSSQVIARFVAA
ncbi:hypothetical protein ACIGGF_11330 [Rhodococcus sp. NPDC078407]